MTTVPAWDVAGAFDELKALHAGMRPARAPLTREMLEPVIGRLGITRVGDLTGLDELGIPVWFAARPASRSLCVSNGKGVSEEAAWLSAVMESAEQAVAEEATALVSLIESPAGLARRGLRSVPLERQSRCAARRLAPDNELAWVKGLSWRTGETVFAPYELVGMDMVTSAPWDVEQFRMSSLGLASGSDLESAMLHGLRELVEEDAIFGPLAGGAPAGRQPEMTFHGNADDLKRVIGMLAEKGVDARFAGAGGDIAMPVVLAALRPRNNEGANQAYFCGSACRSSTEDAALAALLEAVQSRLTFISGARDDLFAEEYGQRLKPGTEALFGGYRLAGGQFGVNRDPAPLATLVSSVLAGGIGDIYVFALGGRRHGFDSVRVLADDLLSLQSVGDYPRGGRAGHKLLRQWVEA